MFGQKTRSERLAHQKGRQPKTRRKARLAPPPNRPTTIVEIQKNYRTVDDLTLQQKALLRRTLAKGTSDDEFALYLWVAKKHHLDPFTRQLHAVKRWSTVLNQEVMTIQIGIDGYRYMAARSHADFGAVDEPEYEFDAKGKVSLARVRVWKKGFEHPTVGIAFWEEYSPADLTQPKAFMWRKMPKHMLGKCAEALALRKAYPDLADIYTDEEMHQAADRNTPSGRAIVDETRIPPGLTPEQQVIADRKISELQEKAAVASKPSVKAQGTPLAQTSIVQPPRAIGEASRELSKPENPQTPEKPPLRTASVGNTIRVLVKSVTNKKPDGKPCVSSSGSPFLIAYADSGEALLNFYLFDQAKFSELKLCLGKELIFQFREQLANGKMYLVLEDFWFSRNIDAEKVNPPEWQDIESKQQEKLPF